MSFTFVFVHASMFVNGKCSMATYLLKKTWMSSILLFRINLSSWVLLSSVAELWSAGVCLPCCNCWLHVLDNESDMMYLSTNTLCLPF